MRMSFLPSRDTMVKEIDQWIVLNKLDMLVGLCNCCLFKVLSVVQECQKCRVQDGIRTMIEGRSTLKGCGKDDVLGLCRVSGGAQGEQPRQAGAGSPPAAAV